MWLFDKKQMFLDHLCIYYFKYEVKETDHFCLRKNIMVHFRIHNCLQIHFILSREKGKNLMY